MDRGRTVTGDRGVSPVVSYVMTLGVTVILVGGLIIGAGSFVEGERQRTAESELQVLGQQTSANLAAADRLYRTEGASGVAVRRTLPRDVVGSGYRIEVRHDDDGPTVPYLELTAFNVDVSVTVGVTNQTAVANSTVGGGELVFTFDDDVDKLVIRDA